MQTPSHMKNRPIITLPHDKSMQKQKVTLNREEFLSINIDTSCSHNYMLLIKREIHPSMGQVYWDTLVSRQHEVTQRNVDFHDREISPAKVAPRGNITPVDASGSER